MAVVPVPLRARLVELQARAATLAPICPGEEGISLRLAGPADAEDRELVARVGSWRAQHMEHFPTQFTVTEEGTARWMREQVLADPDRLMFLMVDTDDPRGPVHGHVGVDHADDARGLVHLNNLVRGDRTRIVRGDIPRIVERFLQWLGHELGAREVRSTPFVENVPSRRMHDTLGFTFVEEIPARRHDLGGRIEYHPVAAGDDAPPDRRWHVMSRRFDA